MKRFVIYSLLFLSPVIVTVIIGVSASIYEWIVFEKSLHVPSKTVAVIGDSHLQYAINDEYIKYAENFAHRASSPNFWRVIARMTYERNPQIKHVVIGINPNIMLQDKGTYKKGLTFSRGHTPAIILFDIMRHDDMGESFQTERMLQRIWGGCILPAIKRVLKLDENISLHEGWFCVKKNVDLEGASWPKERSGEGAPNDLSCGCREVESLIELAEHYGVTPILVTAPIPNRYLSAYTEEQWDYIVRNVSMVASRHNCRWLNYAKSFRDLSCFCDVFHLNAKGAAQFSQILDNDLRRYYPEIDF